MQRCHFRFFWVLVILSLQGLTVAEPVRRPSDRVGPFWPDLNAPKLTTPEWIGEQGVDAAIILAIDDMRDTAKYEAYLRPILDRLKRIDGRAPVSIMTCQISPDDPQLQLWLKEGLNIDVHTLKHPCPLLQGGDLAAAKATVHGCVDLLSRIPNNRPVAFRTPCCDSMSTPSPRVFSEILGKTTSEGHKLAIDSSVMTLITPRDTSLPREIVYDKTGQERFRKYFNPQPPFRKKSLDLFGTYIEDYPYPYLINGTLWEFPCMVPSDWEAFNTHGPNNPATVEDWKAALDATVLKKGVFNFVFHPHGWITAAQMVEFIDYADAKYGRRIKFLNFREALERLTANVPAGAKARVTKDPNAGSPYNAASLPAPLPAGVELNDPQGRDNGVRLVDLNGDGHDDLVFSNAKAYGVYLYNAIEKKNVDWKKGWTMVMREGKAGDGSSLPQIVRADGTDNGVWFKHGAMWVQNEDTGALPEKAHRIPYAELLRQPAPPPRSPEESLKCIHVKQGFTVELVASEPLVQDPVWFDWDASGRLWVVEMADYPFHEYKGKTYEGRIKILEDTNRDGIYDRSTLFLDGLTYPTGLATWQNGVFVASVPEVCFAQDTDGDGRADKRAAILTGFAEGNPQHLVNGFSWGLDGWYYGANGDSGGKVRAAGSGGEYDLSGRDFRFDPRTGTFALQAGKSQYGRWRDDFGNWFGNNNSSLGWHYFLDERYLARNPRLAVPTLRRTLNSDKHVFPVSAGLRRFNWPDAINTLTSGCNPIPYRDNLFGASYISSIFICEPANNLVHHEIVTPDGISFRSERAKDEQSTEFLASEDNWSRFTMARPGPDGCLYIADMYRLVLEHPQWIPQQMLDHLDLRAGEDTGRIYRVKPSGGALRGVPDLSSMDTPQLVESLASSSGWVRDTAQRLLFERRPSDAQAALEQLWGQDSLPAASRVQVAWTLHGLALLREGHIKRACLDNDARVRAHGIRLAEEYLEKPTVLDLVLDAAADAEPLVRMQVALTLGESSDPKIPQTLRTIAGHAKEDADILTALLTSGARHEEALGPEMKQWQAILKKGKLTLDKPKPVLTVPSESNANRNAVVAQYASVGHLNADVSRGRILYMNACASCHRLKNEGVEVGPDLGTIASKPTEQIVEAMFDPSRAVEDRYRTTTITTKTGGTVVGMLTEETANGLTLRTAVGTEVVTREAIAARTTSNLSLMPNGLEAVLKPQDVADILGYIRSK